MRFSKSITRCGSSSLAVQRQEVERFLWQNRFGIDPRELCVITPHLSVVDYYYSGTQTRIGLTPRDWIDGFNFIRVARHKELSPYALAASGRGSEDIPQATGRGLQGVDQAEDSEARS